MEEGRYQYQYGYQWLYAMLVILNIMIEEYERCLMQHSTRNKTPPVHQYREL